MTLADLRKLSIRKQVQIRFRLRNGMECIINDHGVAQVPALKEIPDFNLEEELTFAEEFCIDAPLDPLAQKTAKTPVKPRFISREEMTAMYTAASPATATASHDEE
jgi:hypothetical protein